jgi:hypothetical protein
LDDAAVGWFLADVFEIENFVLTKRAKIAVFGSVVLLVGLTNAIFRSNLGRTDVTTAHPSPQRSVAASATAPHVTDSAKHQDAVAILREIESGFADLEKSKGIPDPERKLRSMALLKRMRESLKGISRDDAAAEIVRILDSGRDYGTALGFTLEAGGILNEAPTWRVALLDLLGQFSPTLSVEYARKIFDSPRSPDEWALGLRSLGWENLTGEYTEEIRNRFVQMLDRQEWLAKPTAGFFQAFDVAVLLSGPTEFSAMASLMKLQDQRGTAVENGTDHAAFLAMDRIAVRKPGETMAQLAADPQLLDWAPVHRGALVSRADVTDPAQLQALENCLATMALRPQELETFVQLFPNCNGAVTNGLVSAPEDLAFHVDLVGRDQASLAQVNRWIEQNSYPALNSGLQQIASRLRQVLTE